MVIIKTAGIGPRIDMWVRLWTRNRPLAETGVSPAVSSETGDVRATYLLRGDAC